MTTRSGAYKTTESVSLHFGTSEPDLMPANALPYADLARLAAKYRLVPSWLGLVCRSTLLPLPGARSATFVGMSVLVRSLLVWLMVLALPSQGLAASGTQHCVPVSPPVHSVATVALLMDGHDHVHAVQLQGHDLAQTAHGSDGLTTDGANLAHGKTAAGAGKCSACASCCPAVGMPPFVSPIPAPLAETKALQLPFMEVESFVPGGLDRPPRTLLA